MSAAAPGRSQAAALPVAWLFGARASRVPILILVFAVAFLQAVNPARLGYFDIGTISASATALALAAIGETVVVLGGSLDLSVGSVVSLVNVALAAWLGARSVHPVVYGLLAIGLSIGVGAAIGAVNGFLVGYVGLQSIIVTLATMFATQGLALLVMKSPGGEFNADFSTLLVGDAVPSLIPSPLVVVALGLAAWLYYKSTRLGVATYAVGSDAGAAASNGAPVAFTRFFSFVVAGAFYGAAGLFLTANSGSGDPLIGRDMLLKVFAAVVLGGTAIGGGRGGAVGSVIGAFILTILVNIFLVLGIRTYYVPIVEGVVLILAVLGFSNFRQSPIWREFLKRPPRAAPRPLSRPPPAAPARAPAPALGWFERRRQVLRCVLPAWALLIVAVAATAAIAGPGFSLISHATTLLVFGSFLAILGFGQGAVILSGGLDLSVGWTITFPAIVLTAYADGSNAAALWAAPLALSIGALVGLVNGLLVVGFGLSPIIATLAVGSILEGVTLVFSNGAPNGATPPALIWFVNGRFAGLPPVVWFLFAFVVVATLALDRSAFSRRLRAVGQNEWIARLSGVRTGAVRIAAYAISGFCGALVGLLLAGFTAQAYYDMGKPYLLASIAAVVLGGVSISGGRGYYLGILGGALLFTALGGMLASTALPDAIRSIIYGFVLLGAVLTLREKPSR